MKTIPAEKIGSWKLPEECIACGAENSYRRQLTCSDKILRRETFNVKHHHWVCTACSTGILGDAEMDEAMRAAVAAYQRAHGLLTAQEIQTARKNKQWSQEALAQRSSLGIATIKRLESGGIIQTKSNDQALRRTLNPSPLNTDFVYIKVSFTAVPSPDRTGYYGMHLNSRSFKPIPQTGGFDPSAHCPC